MPTAVVLGARNLGGAIIGYLVEQGWNVAGVARSRETVETVSERGALGIQADASDAGDVRQALTAAGVKHLHYLPGDNLLGGDGEGTVDGSHPTDLGFHRQADAFAGALAPLLEGKP